MVKRLNGVQAMGATTALIFGLSACDAGTDTPTYREYIPPTPEEAAETRLNQAIIEIEQSAMKGDVTARYFIEIRKRFPVAWDAFTDGAREKAIAGGTFYEMGGAGAQQMNVKMLPIARETYSLASDRLAIESLDYVYDVYTYFAENDLEACAHFAAGTDKGVQSVPSHLKKQEQSILLRIWAEEDDTPKPITTEVEFGEWVQSNFIDKYPQHIEGVLAIGEIDKGDEAARPICQAMIALLDEAKADPEAAKLARLLVAP